MSIGSCEWLAEAVVETSIRAPGGRYDNALTGTINGKYVVDPLHEGVRRSIGKNLSPLAVQLSRMVGIDVFQRVPCHFQRQR